LINSIVDWFITLPEKILGALGGLAEGIGELLKGLFGPILEFDPAQVANMFSLLTEGLVALGELWNLFMVTLNETWTLFSAYLLEQSWPLLTETWIMMLTTWQTVWQAALAVLEEAFRRLVEVVLEGIEIMIEAWNRLGAAIEGVADNVDKVTRAMEKMTSDKMMAKLGKLLEMLEKLHEKWKKIAGAAKEAYEWQTKRGMAGGAGRPRRRPGFGTWPVIPCDGSTRKKWWCPPGRPRCCARLRADLATWPEC